jgi:hypothetical protein
MNPYLTYTMALEHNAELRRDAEMWRAAHAWFTRPSVDARVAITRRDTRRTREAVST